MLVEFRAANHRSLRDEQVLTMEAGRIGDDDDRRPRVIGDGGERLLTAAMIYGANASGKSNVLIALAFMRESVIASHRLWPADGGVPRDPFAWGFPKDEPSTYEVALILNGVRYEYGFVATDTEFTEEWLYAWPKGKKQAWFHRNESGFHFGDNLKGENKLIEEVTRKNALFLSAAIQHRHTQLQPIFSWFNSIQPINVAYSRRFSHPWANEFAIANLLETESRQTASPGDPPPAALAQFKAVLRDADFGIVDLRVIKGESDRPRPPNFMVRHKCATIEDAWLDLREESRGTQALFFMAWPIIEAFQSGGMLLVDELERSLHPSLARQIVLQFNDPDKNPHNAQLVCTTHDTNLLGTIQGDPALRRDQIWLTEKSPEGASELYPLTDFKPRKGENIERGYLQGRYGAIPFLANLSLWWE